jgi:hypothetical protein
MHTLQEYYGRTQSVPVQGVVEAWRQYGRIRGAKTFSEAGQALQAIRDDYIQAVKDEIVVRCVHDALWQVD